MIIKIKKNKRPAPYGTTSSRSGFVILFAVTLAAILLSVALGVSSVAFNEIKFSTSAKDTNDAFYAADTGIECALLNDIGVTTSAFPFDGLAGGSITCLNAPISFSAPVNDPNISGAILYNFIISNLGNSTSGCVSVDVSKRTIDQTTRITARGYNGPCDSHNPNLVQREIETNY